MQVGEEVVGRFKTKPNIPPQESFTRHRVCDGCLAKEYVAKTNVYFRYPILKYRACPFSTDEYRDALETENDALHWHRKPSRFF